MEDLVVPLERNLYGHPLARLLWERQFEKSLLKRGWEKIPNWECLFVHREKGLFLSVCVDDIKLAGKKQNLDLMWKVLNKEVDLGEPTSFLDHVYLGCTQRKCEISKDIVDNYRTMFESRISAGEVDKLPFTQNLRISSWSYEMEGHAKKCVERYCESTSKTTQQLYKVSTPCIDDHHFKKKKWNLLENCHLYTLILFWNVDIKARIGRPYILWSVNKLARSITKWTRACDQRLNRFISYIHLSMWVILLNNAGRNCFKTLISLDILRIQNPLLEEHSVFLEVVHLLQYVVRARNKLRLRTVEQNLKLSLWTLDWDSMVCLLWNHGTYLFLSLEASLMFQIDQGNLIMMLTNITSPTRKSMWWKTLMLFLQMSNPRVKKLYCMGLRTMKQRSKWSLKEGLLQWDMFPGLTELHLIGCLIELIWIPKYKSNTLTPRTNSQTFWPKEISHVMSGIICWACLTLAISVLQFSLLQWRSEFNKNQEKNESQQNQNLWWVLLRGRHRSCCLQLQWAQWKYYGNQDPWKSVVVDDRSGQPDRLSPAGYSKSDYDRSWSSQEWKVRLRHTIDQGNLIKLLGMRCNKFVFIMETLFSTEVRNP